MSLRSTDSPRTTDQELYLRIQPLEPVLKELHLHLDFNQMRRVQTLSKHCNKMILVGDLGGAKYILQEEYESPGFERTDYGRQLLELSIMIIVSYSHTHLLPFPEAQWNITPNQIKVIGCHLEIQMIETYWLLLYVPVLVVYKPSVAICLSLESSESKLPCMRIYTKKLKWKETERQPVRTRDTQRSCA